MPPISGSYRAALQTCSKKTLGNATYFCAASCRGLVLIRRRFASPLIRAEPEQANTRSRASLPSDSPAWFHSAESRFGLPFSPAFYLRCLVFSTRSSPLSSISFLNRFHPAMPHLSCFFHCLADSSSYSSVSSENMSARFLTKGKEGRTTSLTRKLTFKLTRTYAIGVIPVKLVLAKVGNGNPGR